MRLGLVTVGVAVVWAVASGRGLDPRLPRLRWAPVGLLGLLGQLALDRLGPIGDIQVAGEVLSLAALLATCLVNPRLPGMVAITAGVVSNAIAILANTGMPVVGSAVRTIGGVPDTIPLVGHHHLLDATTRLPVLADTLGVSWLGIVISPGDLLVVVGAIIVLSASLVGDVGARPTSRAGHDDVPARDHDVALPTAIDSLAPVDARSGPPAAPATMPTASPPGLVSTRPS